MQEQVGWGERIVCLRPWFRHLDAGGSPARIYMQHLADENGIVKFYKCPTVLPGVVACPPDLPEWRIVNAIAIDTETTGLDESDEVIEAAVLPFQFDRETGDVYAIGEPFCTQGKPDRPIEPEALKKHGITMESLQGKVLDWETIHGWMEDADFILAHNAAFDRGMVERGLKTKGFKVPEKVWGCSFLLGDWKKDDLAPNEQLEVLCAWVGGFWYPPHRADADITAMLHLLMKSKRLKYIYDKSMQSSYEVRLTFKFNDAWGKQLKKRGYRWDGTGKYWWRSDFVGKPAVQDEIGYLELNVFMARHIVGDIAHVKEILPTERFRSH